MGRRIAGLGRIEPGADVLQVAACSSEDRALSETNRWSTGLLFPLGSRPLAILHCDGACWCAGGTAMQRPLARSTVQAVLPNDAAPVEIDVIARRSDPPFTGGDDDAGIAGRLLHALRGRV